MSSIKRIADVPDVSKSKGKPADVATEDGLEDVDGDIYGLAKKVVAALDEIDQTGGDMTASGKKQ